MILIDANILLYAYDATSNFHKKASTWLEECLSGERPVGFALDTLVGFVRMSTHARIFAEPFRVAQALEIIESWLAVPQVSLVLPTEAHWAIFTRLMGEAQVGGLLAQDAHLAALAIEHGATVITHDRDFAKFPGLRVEYPLTASRKSR
jgi:toxin-antitoxin system PIN domain toxin